MLVNVTLSVLLVSYLAGCSSTTSGLYIGTTTGTGASEQIPAKLLKPDGAGAFPAVVIMHDCSGLGPRSSGAPERWAKELLTYGYVVLIRIASQREGTRVVYAPIRLPAGPK